MYPFLTHRDSGKDRNHGRPAAGASFRTRLHCVCSQNRTSQSLLTANRPASPPSEPTIPTAPARPPQRQRRKAESGGTGGNYFPRRCPGRSPAALIPSTPSRGSAPMLRPDPLPLLSSPAFRGGGEDLRKGAKTARLILYFSFHPNEANAMSSSQPVETGSPCTKKSAQNRRRITTSCVEAGRFSARCGQEADIDASVVLFCAPEEATVHRPARAKHARIRLRQGRTIPRIPTKGSLSAEDRAALFHSFCRDAFLAHGCSAVFPFKDAGEEGRLLSGTAGAQKRPPCAAGVAFCIRTRTETAFFPTP